MLVEVSGPLRFCVKLDWMSLENFQSLEQRTI